MSGTSSTPDLPHPPPAAGDSLDPMHPPTPAAAATAAAGTHATTSNNVIVPPVSVHQPAGPLRISIGSGPLSSHHSHSHSSSSSMRRSTSGDTPIGTSIPFHVRDNSGNEVRIHYSTPSSSSRLTFPIIDFPDRDPLDRHAAYTVSASAGGAAGASVPCVDPAPPPFLSDRDDRHRPQLDSPHLVHHHSHHRLRTKHSFTQHLLPTSASASSHHLTTIQSDTNSITPNSNGNQNMTDTTGQYNDHHYQYHPGDFNHTDSAAPHASLHFDEPHDGSHDDMDQHDPHDDDNHHPDDVQQAHPDDQIHDDEDHYAMDGGDHVDHVDGQTDYHDHDGYDDDDDCAACDDDPHPDDGDVTDVDDLDPDVNDPAAHSHDDIDVDDPGVDVDGDDVDGDIDVDADIDHPHDDDNVAPPSGSDPSSTSTPWNFTSSTNGFSSPPTAHNGVYIQPFQPQPDQQNAYAAHLEQLYALHQHHGPYHYSHQLVPPTLGMYGGYGGPGSPGGYDATLEYVDEDDELGEYDEDAYADDDVGDHLDPTTMYQEESTPYLERLRRKCCTPSIRCQQKAWFLTWQLYEWILFLGVLFIIFGNSVRRMVLKDEIYQQVFDDIFLFFFIFFTFEFCILLKYHPFYRREYHLIFLDFLAIISILPFISIIWDPMLNAILGSTMSSKQPMFHDDVNLSETPMNYHSRTSLPGTTSNNEFHPHTFASLSLIMLMRTAFLVRIIRFIKQRIFNRFMTWLRLKRSEYIAQQRKRAWIIRAKDRQAREKVRRKLARDAQQQAAMNITAAKEAAAAGKLKHATQTHAPSKDIKHDTTNELYGDGDGCDPHDSDVSRSIDYDDPSPSPYGRDRECDVDRSVSVRRALEGSDGLLALSSYPQHERAHSSPITLSLSPMSRSSPSASDGSNSVRHTSSSPDSNAAAMALAFSGVSFGPRLSIRGHSGGAGTGGGGLRRSKLNDSLHEIFSQEHVLPASNDNIQPSSDGIELAVLTTPHTIPTQPIATTTLMTLRPTPIDTSSSTTPSESPTTRTSKSGSHTRHVSTPLTQVATYFTSQPSPHDHSRDASSNRMNGGNSVVGGAPKRRTSSGGGGGVFGRTFRFGSEHSSIDGDRKSSSSPHSSRHRTSRASSERRADKDGSNGNIASIIHPDQGEATEEEKATAYAMSHLSSMQSTALAQVAPFAGPNELSHELYDSETPPRIRHSGVGGDGLMMNGAARADVDDDDDDDDGVDGRGVLLDGSSSVHHHHPPVGDATRTVGFAIDGGVGVVDDDDDDDDTNFDDDDWDDHYARSHMRDPDDVTKDGHHHTKVLPPPALEQTIIGSFTSHQLSDFTTTLLIFIVLLIVYLYHILHDLPFDDVAKVGLERLSGEWYLMEQQLWNLNIAMKQGNNLTIHRLYDEFLDTFISFDVRVTYYFGTLPIVHLSLQHSPGFFPQNLEALNWSQLTNLFNQNNNTTNSTSSSYLDLNFIFEPSRDIPGLRERITHSPFFLSLVPGIHTYEEMRKFEDEIAEDLAQGRPLPSPSPIISPPYFLFQDDVGLSSLNDEEITRWASEIETRFPAFGNDTSFNTPPTPIGLVFVDVSDQAYSLFLYHTLYILFFIIITSLLLFRYDLHIQKILKPIERMMLFIEKMMADPLGEIMLSDPHGGHDHLNDDDEDDDEEDESFVPTTSVIDEDEDSKNWSHEEAELAAAERQILIDADETIRKKKTNMVGVVDGVGVGDRRHSLSKGKLGTSAYDDDSVSPPGHAISLRRHRRRSSKSASRRSPTSSPALRPSPHTSRRPSQQRRESVSRSGGLRRRRGSESIHKRDHTTSEHHGSNSKISPSRHDSPHSEPRKDVPTGESTMSNLKLMENGTVSVISTTSTNTTAITAAAAGGGGGSNTLVVKSSSRTAGVNKFSNETSTVEKSLLKLALLLQVGFGVAGSSIISNNLVAGDLLNPIQQGRKIFGIFGFCDLKPVVQSYFDSGEEADELMRKQKKSTDEIILHVGGSGAAGAGGGDSSHGNESFIEQIMIFINQLQAIVHGETHKYGGFINSSIGSNTLMAWKFDVEGFERMEHQYGYGPLAPIPLPNNSSIVSPIHQPIANTTQIVQSDAVAPFSPLQAGLPGPALGSQPTSGTAKSILNSNTNSTTPLFSPQPSSRPPQMMRQHSLSIATGAASFSNNVSSVSNGGVGGAGGVSGASVPSSIPPPTGSPFSPGGLNSALPSKKRSLSISAAQSFAISPLLAPSTPSRPIQRRSSLSQLASLGSSTPTQSVGLSAIASLSVSGMSSIPMSISMRGLSGGGSSLPSDPHPFVSSRRNSASSGAISLLPDRAPSPRVPNRPTVSPLKRASTIGHVPPPTNTTTGANATINTLPIHATQVQPVHSPVKSPGLQPRSPRRGSFAVGSNSPLVGHRIGTPEPVVRVRDGPPMLARSQTLSFAMPTPPANNDGAVTSPPRKALKAPSPRLGFGLPPPHATWNTAATPPALAGLPAPALNGAKVSTTASTTGSSILSVSNSSNNLSGLIDRLQPIPSATTLAVRLPSGASMLYDNDETPAKVRPISDTPTASGAIVPAINVASNKPRYELLPPTHARHRSFTPFDGGDGESESSSISQRRDGKGISPLRGSLAAPRRAHMRTTSTGSELTALDLTDSAQASIPTTPLVSVSNSQLSGRPPIQRRASLPSLSYRDTATAQISSNTSSNASTILRPHELRALAAESQVVSSSSSHSVGQPSSLNPLLDASNQFGTLDMDKLDLLRQASLSSSLPPMMIGSESRPSASRTASLDTSQRDSTNASSPSRNTATGGGASPNDRSRSRTLVLAPRRNSIPELSWRGGNAGSSGGGSLFGGGVVGGLHSHHPRHRPHSSLNQAMASLLAAAAMGGSTPPGAPAPSPAFQPIEHALNDGNGMTNDAIPEVAQHPKAMQDTIDVHSYVDAAAGHALPSPPPPGQLDVPLVDVAFHSGASSGRHTPESMNRFENMISVRGLHDNNNHNTSQDEIIANGANDEAHSPPLTICLPPMESTPSNSLDWSVPPADGTLSVHGGRPLPIVVVTPPRTSIVSHPAHVGLTRPRSDDGGAHGRMRPAPITPPRSHEAQRASVMTPITPPAYEENGHSNASEATTPTAGALMPSSRIHKKRPPALFDAGSQNQLDLLAAAAASSQCPSSSLDHPVDDSSGRLYFNRLDSRVGSNLSIPVSAVEDGDLSSPTSPKRRLQAAQPATWNTHINGNAIQGTAEEQSESRRYSASNSLAYPPPAASAIYGPNPYGPSFPSTAIPSPAFRPMVGPSSNASPLLRYSSPPPIVNPAAVVVEDLSPDSANIDSLTEDPTSPHNDIVKAFIRMGLHPYGQMELRRTASQALLAFTKTLVKIATDQSLERWRKHSLLKPHLTGIGGMAVPGMPDSPETGLPPLCNRGAGMGLHIGWAIEGAIGSRHKIDATYLSPNVNLAARLAAATKQYYVALLFSHNFLKLLPQILRDRCRLVDHVQLKGTAKPMRIYTFDIFMDLPPSNGAGMMNGATSHTSTNPTAGVTPTTAFVTAATPSPAPIDAAATPSDATPAPTTGGGTHARQSSASSRIGTWGNVDLAELSRLSHAVSNESGGVSNVSLPRVSYPALPAVAPPLGLMVSASLDQDMAKLNLNRRSSLTGHVPRELPPTHIRRRTSLSQANAQAAQQQQQVEMALLATQQQQQQQAQQLQLQHHLHLIQQQQQQQLQSQQQDLAAVFDVPNSDPTIECLSPSPIPAPTFNFDRRRTSAPAAFTFTGATQPPPPPPDIRLTVMPPPPPPPPSSLTTDPILQKLLFVLFSLQHSLPNPLFILTHNHATHAYIHGDWYLARQLYEQVLAWEKTDGPARMVLEFMARTNYQTPPDWKGYRKLDKK